MFLVYTNKYHVPDNRCKKYEQGREIQYINIWEGLREGPGGI